MNYLLWALQVILAIKLLSVAFTHGIRPNEEKRRRGRERYGEAVRPLLAVIAIAAALAAIALVLPAATGVRPAITAVAAALVAVMMLVAIAFHLACRDRPMVPVSVVLAAMAAFLAYGRWVVLPL